MPKSYFAILGVGSGASPEEIRSAYRRLAKEFHPDHFEGDSGLFREVQEAYSVLGDAQKRNQYQKSLEAVRPPRPVRPSARSTPEPLIPGQRPVDLGEISPTRHFQTYNPSIDEIFDWLWHKFFS